MEKETNINKKAEKIVYKLLSNPNKSICFTINGNKIKYRFCQKTGLWTSLVGRKFGWNLSCVVGLKDDENPYRFYKERCESEIKLAVAKEFMKQIQEKLGEEIVFNETSDDGKYKEWLDSC